MQNMIGGRRWLVATLGLGLVVAGCGSSSSSSKTSSTAAAPALTKAEYVTQGNAICKTGHARQQAALVAYAKVHHLNLNSNSAPTKAQAAGLAATVVIPHIQSQISKVKALVPPSSDRAQVTAMIAAAQGDLDRVKQNPALLFGNANPFADAGKLLHAYGLTSCAKNSG